MAYKKEVCSWCKKEYTNVIDRQVHDHEKNEDYKVCSERCMEETIESD